MKKAARIAIATEVKTLCTEAGRNWLRSKLKPGMRRGMSGELGSSTRSNTGLMRTAIIECAAPARAMRMTERMRGGEYGRTKRSRRGRMLIGQLATERQPR